MLAGRKSKGRIVGEVLFNGRSLREAELGRISGYVEQSDSHEPYATVREAVQFAAHTRLPRTLSTAEKEKRVENTLAALDLLGVADKVIGSPETGGIAPELRKKVTIAVELVVGPAVLFLDEPVSGSRDRDEGLLGAQSTRGRGSTNSHHLVQECAPGRVVCVFALVLVRRCVLKRAYARTCA